MTGSTTGRAAQRGLELAYRYVDRRERTVSEVRAHLLAKELDDAAIDATLQELTELGVLDDARFARVFAEDKRVLEQWGVERIKRKLLERGVERELVEAALGEHQAETEIDRALAVLCRRFPEVPRDRRERDRALGVLLRKGYDIDSALEAVRSYSDSAAEH